MKTPDPSITVWPEVHVTDSVVIELPGNQVLVRSDKNDSGVAAASMLASRDVRAETYAITIAFEHSGEFVIAGPIAIEDHIEHDQPRACLT